MEQILHYFPDLTDKQKSQFAQLDPLYRYWNQLVNVISRTDIDNLYERHVLHSLAIARVTGFVAGTRIIDVGTGGGFPGIPLAILFPEVQFHLIDSIGKKIKVVEAITKDIGLQNVSARQQRAEEVTGRFDFMVSRAVTRTETLVRWAKGFISKSSGNDLPNGLLLLKGGNLTEELASVRGVCYTFPIADYFAEPFFDTKQVVYVAM